MINHNAPFVLILCMIDEVNMEGDMFQECYFVVPECITFACRKSPNSLLIAGFLCALFSRDLPCILTDEQLESVSNFTNRALNVAVSGALSLGLIFRRYMTGGKVWYGLTEKGEGLLKDALDAIPTMTIYSDGKTEHSPCLAPDAASPLHVCVTRTRAYADAYGITHAGTHAKSVHLGGVKEGLGEGEGGGWGKAIYPPIGGYIADGERVQREGRGEGVNHQGEPARDIGEPCISATYLEPPSMTGRYVDEAHCITPFAVDGDRNVMIGHNPPEEESTELEMSFPDVPIAGVISQKQADALNTVRYAKALPDLSYLFETHIWAPHPTRKGSRVNCLEKCARMTAEGFVTLCQTFPFWVAYWRKMIDRGEGQYIPHPQTFLNRVLTNGTYDEKPPEEAEQLPVAKTATPATVTPRTKAFVASEDKDKTTVNDADRQDFLNSVIGGS